jgi:hypothetical protein
VFVLRLVLLGERVNEAVTVAVLFVTTGGGMDGQESVLSSSLSVLQEENLAMMMVQRRTRTTDSDRFVCFMVLIVDR